MDTIQAGVQPSVWELWVLLIRCERTWCFVFFFCACKSIYITCEMQKAFSAVSLYYTELYLFDITHICTYVRGVLVKMRKTMVKKFFDGKDSRSRTRVERISFWSSAASDLLPFQTFEDLVCTVLDTLFSISERGHFWCPQTPKKTNKHLSLEGSLRLVLPRTSQTSRVITHQIPWVLDEGQICYQKC